MFSGTKSRRLAAILTSCAVLGVLATSGPAVGNAAITKLDVRAQVRGDTVYATTKIRSTSGPNMCHNLLFIPYSGLSWNRTFELDRNGTGRITFTGVPAGIYNLNAGCWGADDEYVTAYTIVTVR